MEKKEENRKKRKKKKKRKTKRRKTKRRIRSAQCSYLNPGRGTYLEGTVATTEVGDEVGPGMLQDAQGVLVNPQCMLVNPMG